MDELVDRVEFVEDRLDFLIVDLGEATVPGVQVVRDLGDASVDLDGLRQKIHVPPRLALGVSAPHPLGESPVVVLV